MGALVGAWVGVVCTVLQSRQALLLVSQSDWLIFSFSIRVQSTRLELSSMCHVSGHASKNLKNFDVDNVVKTTKSIVV